jgi:multicomponent Na+:H+ antiporter subunit E
MTLALLVLLLALVWVAITDGFTLVNLLFGVAIALLAVYVLRDDFARPRMLRRLRRVLALALLFFWELGVSAVRVALIVLRPNLRKALRPAIVAVPLQVTRDWEITLLACLITLTPGTLSVDVSEDRKTLFIHVLDLDDREALLASIRDGFERRIVELSA